MELTYLQSFKYLWYYNPCQRCRTSDISDKYFEVQYHFQNWQSLCPTKNINVKLWLGFKQKQNFKPVKNIDWFSFFYFDRWFYDKIERFNTNQSSQIAFCTGHVTNLLVLISEPVKSCMEFRDFSWTQQFFIG